MSPSPSNTASHPAYHPAAHPATSNPAPNIALPWIVRLRFAMAAGQISAILGANRLLHIELPVLWSLIAPLVVILSNVWLSKRAASGDQGARVNDSALISGMFVTDTLCLTAVLMLTGGPNNPFSLLYLVHITLSATILRRSETWALGLLACVCFAALFRFYRPIAALEMHHGGGSNMHLTGMWVAFAIGTFLVTMFSGKISELLREREESLLRMQEELAKKDRLASLVTLSAGAAHELSTPLGTIAVVAKDLERYATLTVRDGSVADDSRLIRTEVERCRQILQRMSVDGAEPAGEAMERVSVASVLDAARRAFPEPAVLEIEASAIDMAESLTIPRHAVEQALIALVKNGIEAGLPGAVVNVSVRRFGGSIRFTVTDRGCGMSQECLRHAGEPFFTTKEPGKGMGLGVFLVRTVADRLGGRLRLESLPGAGTSAVLELPCDRNADQVAV